MNRTLILEEIFRLCVAFLGQQLARLALTPRAAQVRFMDDDEIICNVHGEETVDDVKRKVSVETGEHLENPIFKP